MNKNKIKEQILSKKCEPENIFWPKINFSYNIYTHTTI